MELIHLFLVADAAEEEAEDDENISDLPEASEHGDDDDHDLHAEDDRVVQEEGDDNEEVREARDIERESDGRLSTLSLDPTSRSYKELKGTNLN